MAHTEVYVNDSDGTIQHVYPSFMTSDNDAGTTLVLSILEIEANQTILDQVYDNSDKYYWDTDEFKRLSDDVVVLNAATVTAYNDAVTESGQIESAALVAIQNGQAYLQRQYLSASPNLTTIYNTLSSAVAGNADLTQMMDNQIAVYQLETGESLASITTNADRARYIECVRRVIALLA